MRATVSALFASDLCTGTEVDLEFFRRLHLHASEWELLSGLKSPDESIDRPVLSIETVLRAVVLVVSVHSWALVFDGLFRN